MSDTPIGRDRVLRRHRRSRLQADLSGPAWAGARRGGRASRSSASPRRAGASTSSRRAPRTASTITAARTTASFAQVADAAALRRRRLQRSGDVRAAARQRSARRSGRCTISAIPPCLFGVVVSALAEAGCAENARLVMEKPFGHDRESAAALNRILLAHFPEERDLPHRPYPGQGAGAEHRLHPVRQFDLRADLEPPVRARASRSPWRRIFGVQDRGAVLRRDRRDARRAAEPPAAGARAT